MSEEKLSSLAVLHIHKHKRVDIDSVSEFFRREGDVSPFSCSQIYSL